MKSTRSSRSGVSMLALAAAAAALAGTGAHAALVVSSGANNHVTCSQGVCTATAKNAVLNVKKLENLLASGNVDVVSGSLAQDIATKAKLSWSSSSTLTLDAYRSIAFEAPVTVTGAGGVTLLTNDGGTGGVFGFYSGANMTFANLSSPLTINGASYGLVGDITTLATAVEANENGNYALANNYDASGDGTYSHAPVQTVSGYTGYNGIFEGLGNVISNLTINDGSASGALDGLFDSVNGTIRDFGLASISVTSTGDQGANDTGTLTAGSDGTIWRSWATGSVSQGRLGFAGGLVGTDGGTISQSWANVNVSCTSGCNGGGLAGIAYVVDQSFFMGSMSSGDYGYTGGLVGRDGQGATISQSYNVGSVSLSDPNASNDLIGGLIGCSGCGTAQAGISQSYSTGAVSAPNSGCNMTNCVGGVIGYDTGGDTNTKTYWDLTTSGIKNKSEGAGNVANDPGLRGLTDKKLLSRLPRGFDRRVWAENPNINGGYPYLIANPPPQ